MLEKPNLSDDKMSAGLREAYGIDVSAIEFLPIGNDATAWVYRVVGQGGAAYFLKLKSSGVYLPSVNIPRFLRDNGMHQIVAPLATLSGDLWTAVEDYRLILYPFIDGQSGMEVGLSDAQWIELGRVLRQMHTIQLPDDLAKQLKREAFIPGPTWLHLVKELNQSISVEAYNDPFARELAAYWLERAAEIRQMTVRAEELGRMCQSRALPVVLCHADIHTANVLVDEQGGLHIVDWDQPILAPKERDLMFMLGEGGEAQFYEGYGDVEVDQAVIAYYRYEWVVQEFGDYAARVLVMDDVGDETRADAVRGFQQLFDPGDVVDQAYEADSF
jgi:spectinomycin phosphotransferase